MKQNTKLNQKTNANDKSHQGAEQYRQQEQIRNNKAREIKLYTTHVTQQTITIKQETQLKLDTATEDTETRENAGT